jgi:hypothetical protein
VVIEYGHAGFTPGDGTGTSVTVNTTGATDTHSHTLGGLTSGASYDIYLTPLCGGTTTCYKLKTTMAPAEATPYCEDMEAALPGGIPFGWTVGRSNSGTPEMAALGGSQTLHMKASAANPSMAALPRLAVDDIETHQLTLRLRTDSQPLRDFTLTQLDLAGYDVVWTSDDERHDRPNEPSSEYEQRLTAQGAPVYGIWATPNPNAALGSVRQTASLSLVDYLPTDLNAMTYVPHGMQGTVLNLRNRATKRAE